MNSFADHMVADRRLTMLRVLLSSVSYSSNTTALQTMTARLGYSVSQDRIQTDVGWLVEQGLATTEDIAGLLVVTLTQRGQDVVERRVIVPGVARPRAGEV